MAQGDLALFNQFKKDLCLKLHDLENDAFKLAFTSLQVGGTPTITAADADPRWGAGGTTNLSSSQVSGTNYFDGGNSCASLAPSISESSGIVKFDLADPATWNQHESGPTNIKSAVLYNDTDTGKRAVGFIEMTSDGTTAISLATGDITVSFNASGIFTLA